MRRPRSGAVSPSRRNSWGACAIEIGTCASWPAWIAKSRARSRTLRAIGPSVPSWLIHTSAAGQNGMRPWLGRRPKTLFHAAGLRSDPMKSDPSATGSSRCASATAAPPLLPPALTALSQAFGVVPNRLLKVCEPRPNSGMLVLAITMQPAPFMRAVITLSCVATASFISVQP